MEPLGYMYDDGCGIPNNLFFVSFFFDFSTQFDLWYGGILVLLDHGPRPSTPTKPSALTKAHTSTKVPTPVGTLGIPSVAKGQDLENFL